MFSKDYQGNGNKKKAKKSKNNPGTNKKSKRNKKTWKCFFDHNKNKAKYTYQSKGNLNKHIKSFHHLWDVAVTICT